jgi:hypothetical protein
VIEKRRQSVPGICAAPFRPCSMHLRNHINTVYDAKRKGKWEYLSDARVTVPEGRRTWGC